MKQHFKLKYVPVDGNYTDVYHFHLTLTNGNDKSIHVPIHFRNKKYQTYTVFLLYDKSINEQKVSKTQGTIAHL